MIDFRYHLVSLISVFLALAVGVVLGAGPLQGSLGTALNDQVAALREERKATQLQLEQTATAVNERDNYITQAAAGFLPGTLEGKTVAIVVLPEAKNEDIEAIQTQIQAAGGSVDGRFALTQEWIATSRAGYRSTYSGQVASALGEPASKDADAILGEGLGKALTSSEAEAATLKSLLTATGQPLMTVESQPSAPASMIVVVGPRPTGGPEAKATATASGSVDPAVWAKSLGGVASAATTVVVGSADGEASLIGVIRSARAQVTTVDSVGQATAAVSTPLALAATDAGTRSHYGFDEGAQAVIPPVAR